MEPVSPASKSVLLTQHHRYQLQARWSATLRAHLLKLVGLQRDHTVLEVGSGSGAVCSTIPSDSVFALDIDLRMTQFAHQFSPGARYICGDGNLLPFCDHTFNHVFCHFLLLWLPDPEHVLGEMRRVLKPGGWLLLMAEPDYGARIDYPDELALLGEYQATALQDQGADPNTGRKTRQYLTAAQLDRVQAGILGGEWSSESDQAQIDSEWQTLRSDLKGQLAADELERLEALDRAAWKNGRRILFVPTFYALGQKPLPRSTKPGSMSVSPEDPS